MKFAEAALQNLIHLARVDGVVTGDEREMIERYATALDVTPGVRDRLLRTRRPEIVCPSEFTATPTERIHVLKMLVRVAHADGRLHRRERRLLQSCAESLGIGPLEFADICVAVDHETGTRHGLRRAHLVAIVAAPLILMAIFAAYHVAVHHSDLADQAARADRQALSLFAQSIDESARRESQHSLARVAETEQRVDQRMRELGDSLSALERELERATPSPAIGDAASSRIQREIEHLRTELARLRDARAAFQQCEREASRAVVLIYWSVELLPPAGATDLEPRRRSGWASGFFVREDGLIVTNKHVVHSWLFQADAVHLCDAGYRVDRDNMLIAAWPAGALVRRPDGKLDLGTAYSTSAGTLRLVATAPDQFEERERDLGDGRGSHRGRYHTADRHDLALLAARVSAPVPTLRLAPVDRVVIKLEPVMVLGFPGGISVRESPLAITAPSLGEVRKVETSIFIDAPIVPGNSGGPLLDVQGEVIGVATATYGDATVGGCIPSRYVHELIDSVR